MNISMNKYEAIKWLRAKSYQEFCKEPCEIAIKALEELNLYEQNGLCLIPSNVYERQCEELDRLKEKERLRRNTSVSDGLFVSVDFSPNDEDVVVVMRNMNNHVYVVNIIKNEEAREVHDKLIGVR